jgi:3-oxoacyl-[acyl-carrier-protein] synthase III
MGALTDKYCIVGVGETPHMRPSNRTTLSMVCEAISNAMADAGLEPSDIDGITSYQAADSTSSAHVATAPGMRLNYCLDILGGGSSTEALVASAIAEAFEHNRQALRYGRARRAQALNESPGARRALK